MQQFIEDIYRYMAILNYNLILRILNRGFYQVTEECAGTFKPLPILYQSPPCKINDITFGYEFLISIRSYSCLYSAINFIWKSLHGVIKAWHINKDFLNTLLIFTPTFFVLTSKRHNFDQEFYILEIEFFPFSSNGKNLGRNTFLNIWEELCKLMSAGKLLFNPHKTSHADRW